MAVPVPPGMSMFVCGLCGKVAWRDTSSFFVYLRVFLCFPLFLCSKKC